MKGRKHTVTIECAARVVMEHTEGDNNRQHMISAACAIAGTSDNVDEDVYFDTNGNHNDKGIELITNTLVQGLVANIHYAHQRGIKDSADHLRFIISELERGFVAQGEAFAREGDESVKTIK